MHLSSSTIKNQPVSLLPPDGSNITVPLSVFDKFGLSRAQSSIIYGVQLGMSGMVFLILLVTAKREKRRTILYYVHLTSLLLLMVKSVLFCVFETGPWLQYSVQLLGDFAAVTDAAYHTSAATNVITTLLVISIEVSLVFQVRVVYSSARTFIYRTLMTVSGCISLVVFAFYIVSLVEGIRSVYGNAGFDGWSLKAATASFAASICFYSLVFTIKLYLAIRQRRSLGFEKFGPLQVIFIMGCQTLLIPAVMTIIDSSAHINSIGAFAQTIVVVSLPISALWASTTKDNNADRQRQQSVSSSTTVTAPASYNFNRAYGGRRDTLGGNSAGQHIPLTPGARSVATVTACKSPTLRDDVAWTPSELGIHMSRDYKVEVSPDSDSNLGKRSWM